MLRPGAVGAANLPLHSELSHSVDLVKNDPESVLSDRSRGLPHPLILSEENAEQSVAGMSDEKLEEVRRWHDRERAVDEAIGEESRTTDLPR